MEARRPGTAPPRRTTRLGSAPNISAVSTRSSRKAAEAKESTKETAGRRVSTTCYGSKRETTPPQARPQTASAATKKNRTASTKTVAKGKVEWGRMNVFVRGRPLSKAELKASAVDCVEVANSSTVYLHEFCGTRDYLRMKRLKTRQYNFDHVFNMFDSQQHVYAQSTAPLVESVLKGQNASCLCYGATGTGKTHTMLGSVDDPGVMIFAFRELFDKLDSQAASVTLTYVEIYNETLRDLLNPNGGNLELRELPGKGVRMNGVKEVSAESAEDVLKLLHMGNKHRRTESTRCNRTSSRSHALLQIKVVSQEGEKTTTGKLSLVDLAGSERTIATEKKRSCRSVEGANINKSLLALSSCIRALVEGKSHIPFRNSKLTLMLKDSLGGTCQTAMIATVSPSSDCLGETSNTLHWAERAKMIPLPGATTRHETYAQTATATSSASAPTADKAAKQKDDKKEHGEKNNRMNVLKQRHSELADRLASLPTTRTRKRVGVGAQGEQSSGTSVDASKGGSDLSKIKSLEHEVKRLKSENERQRCEFQTNMQELKREHHIQMKAKDDVIQKLLQEQSNRRQSLEITTLAKNGLSPKPIILHSGSLSPVRPSINVFVDDKATDKENAFHPDHLLIS